MTSDVLGRVKDDRRNGEWRLESSEGGRVPYNSPTRRGIFSGKGSAFEACGSRLDVVGSRLGVMRSRIDVMGPKIEDRRCGIEDRDG